MVPDAVVPDAPTQARVPATTPPAPDPGVTGSTAQARTRTTVVLLVLVLVMAAVLLFGVLMLVLRGTGGAG